MMPTTPSGTRMRATSMPVGRRTRSEIFPTGSSSATTASTPAAICSMSFGVRRRRSRKAASRPLVLRRSSSLAARIAFDCARISAAIASSARFLVAFSARASSRAAARAAMPRSWTYFPGEYVLDEIRAAADLRGFFRVALPMTFLTRCNMAGNILLDVNSYVMYHVSHDDQAHESPEYLDQARRGNQCASPRLFRRDCGSRVHGTAALGGPPRLLRVRQSRRLPNARPQDGPAPSELPLALPRLQGAVHRSQGD